MQEITFTLNAQDIYAFDHRAALPNKRAAIRRPLMVIALIPFCLGAVFFANRKEGDTIWTFLSTVKPVLIEVLLLITVIFGGWWLLALWNLRASQYTDENLARISPHLVPPSTFTVRISPTDLYRRDGSGESYVPWKTIHSVSDDNERIYLFYASGTGFVIPKRAFDSSADAVAFYEAMTSYWQTANSK